ncbi:hypothetical protein VTJ83DRAFT_3678 [Remersonia thermophila]|uniref:Tyrosinase copper-binding domain-containing protein n=1 Tax=Remersonia thermophila TaxID=72144 RepID=A0ABR4DGW0_9PEZI
MTRFSLAGLVTALLAGVASADPVLDLQNQGRPQIDAALARSSTCTKEKLQVRREWGDLSAGERKAYINAMLCMMSKPSKLDQTRYPGSKTRYDDFVVVHMNQTMTIHGTGNFLSWHRYYTWAFEQALRNECGYNGTQPYWDWSRWYQDPERSPIFDGSDTSLSGNGEYVQHTTQMGIPAGNGGGCVKTGPFKDMVIRLGPMANVLHVNPPIPRNPRADGYGDNPRCLRRDMSNKLSTTSLRPQDVVNLIVSSNNIGTFQDVMQGTGFGGSMGVHGAGHFTISGDPGGDFYTSPNDPAFYVHHAMIDRVWYIWQSLNFPSRQQVIAGGTSMMGWNSPPAKLTDVVDLGPPGIAADHTYTISQLVSTVEGPFCYIYE